MQRNENRKVNLSTFLHCSSSTWPFQKDIVLISCVTIQIVNFSQHHYNHQHCPPLTNLLSKQTPDSELSHSEAKQHLCQHPPLRPPPLPGNHQSHRNHHSDATPSLTLLHAIINVIIIYVLLPMDLLTDFGNFFLDGSLPKKVNERGPTPTPSLPTMF